jgi:hypothetical protein
MKGILTDINVQGQVRILMAILLGESWRDFWALVNLPLRTFRDLGLSPDASDAAVWQLCRQEQLVLITGNRNAEGPDSLEATLRARNTPDTLPVFTIADPQRVLHSREYAERVAVRWLEYLLDIDRVRGTGRLYLP